MTFAGTMVVATIAMALASTIAMLVAAAGLALALNAPT